MTASLPALTPSQASQMRAELPVTEIRFGNGYASRRQAGLRPAQRYWTLVWSALSRAECQMLDSFFVEHAGTIPFAWEPPSLTGRQLYLCQNWQTINQAGALFELTARLVPHQ